MGWEGVLIAPPPTKETSIFIIEEDILVYYEGNQYIL
jgi:hypothetical protein